MLLQYAREHHFPNPTFFVDDGVSGVTYDRPGFQAMLAEIEAGRVAVAIAKDLSRLGRNSALTGLYTNFTFPQNGVRFIAINDNYDTIDPNRVDNDFAGIKNWFNEFYARDTSRKIRAVQKAKGERGVPLTTNVPYGYVKDLENPRRWVVDPVAADVVKRIFDLCMKGRGPMQIANQLKADKVLTPSAYRALQGIKTPNKKPEDPCDWHSSTVVAILERREYTGCINFPLAHHRLHLEISIVVVKRQTMFRTELHQCFDTFSRTLFVGDRDRIDDILLRTWLTMPAWAVAGTDSVLITRKADQLVEPCDLRAVSAVECPIPLTCPECQPWLRECHNVAFLGIGKGAFLECSFTLLFSTIKASDGTLFVLAQRTLLRGLRLLWKNRKSNRFVLNRLRIAVLTRPSPLLRQVS